MQCHTLVGGIKKRKRSWTSRKRAKIGLRNVAKRYGFDPNDFEVYRCSECGDYHYGHKETEEVRTAVMGQGGVAYA